MGVLLQRSRVPVDLEGEAEARPFLARGEGKRRASREGSPWRGCFLGGVAEGRLTAFLGEGEELLPEEEGERERRLEDRHTTSVTVLEGQSPSLVPPGASVPLPAEGGATASVPGTWWPTSGRAPAARRHPPPGAGPTAGGVGPWGEQIHL